VSASASTRELAGWLVVVPARLKSERLPEKPLQDLGGLPLIVRVARNLAPLAAAGAEVVVATDAEKISSICAAHGIKAVMTDVAHQSGTDRCAEVAAKFSDHPYVMNVQGDEPFVSIEDLRRLAAAMRRQATIDIGTLVYENRDPVLAADPNVVKAVRRADGTALYFSRAPIPFRRDANPPLPATYWQHIGIYAFKRERLLAFVKLPPSLLEQSEKLEQLRALEQGWRLWLEPATHWSRGIDTPADLEAARAKI
jgi:3-deoxy-manno-octulosonate cytidylyltransferase (CMP-KDO synthetase)